MPRAPRSKAVRASRFVAASHGRWLLALAEKWGTNRTPRSGARAATPRPCALDRRVATTEIGAHFMHVYDRNPTIVNAGM